MNEKVLYAAHQLRGAAFAWFEPTITDSFESNSAAGRGKETNQLFESFPRFEMGLKQMFRYYEERRSAAVHFLRSSDMKLLEGSYS
jgi:hypothetical protein